MLSRSVQRVAPSLACRRRYAAGAATESKAAAKNSTDPAASSFKKKNKREKIKPKPKRTWDPLRQGVRTFTPLPTKELKSPLFKSKPVQAEYPPLQTKTILETTSPRPVTFLNKEKVNPLSKYGLPRNLLLDTRFFSAPVSIIRSFTKTLVEELKAARKDSSDKSRLVLYGNTGSGKSYLLLQAAHFCNRDGWIVLYVPRAIKLLDSSTAYEYDARSQTYVQHEFARHILARLLEVEGSKLKQIPISDTTANAHSWLSIKSSHTVASLIPSALAERTPAMDYLSLVFTALSEQKEYPVLLAIDDFQALFRQSLYRNPQYYLLDSYHLSIPRLLLEYSSGRRSFRKGTVLGAVSCTDKRFDVPLEVREAIGMPSNQPTSIWSKRIPVYVEYAKGLRGLNVPDKFSLEEAIALFELWQQTGVFASEPTDEFFLSKYSETAGNPRDFVWKGLLGTLKV